MSPSTAADAASSLALEDGKGATPARTPIAAAGFTLKKAASSGVKIPAVSAALPQPKVKSTTAPQSDGWLRGASGAVLQMICVLGRQLLSMAGMQPKWTGLWIVLEAGDGSAASPFTGKVINCAVGADAEHDDLAKDWWNFRGGEDGRRRRQQAAARGAGGAGRPQSAAGADGGAGKGRGGPDQGIQNGHGRDGGEQDSGGSSGDAVSSDSEVYPPTTQHTRGTVRALAAGELGSKELKSTELNELLATAGLDDVREISTDDLMDMFARGSRLLRKRAGAKFSWALSCPLELLGNKWTSPALPVSVDGSHFLPLNHPSSKGHGTDRKRLVLCVAAHVSPFWRKVFDVHFVETRVSGRKRRYRPKDPFEGADILGGQKTKKQRGATNKTAADKKARTKAATAARLMKAQEKAAKRVAAARVTNAARATKEKVNAASAAAATAAAKARAPPPRTLTPPGNPVDVVKPLSAGPGRADAACRDHRDDGAAGDSGGNTIVSFLTPEPLWALQRAAAVTPIRDVWTRRPIPVLPPTTVISVERLSGPPLAAAVRASTKVRVVLPRALLKDAFTALAAAARSGDGDVSDGDEVAVRIGDHNPTYAFQTTLVQMSAVLAFNDGIVSSAKFICFLRKLAATDAHLPAPLNFLTGQPISVLAMVHHVIEIMAGRLLDDCVWSLPPVRPTAAPTERTGGSFAGFMANVQDVCDAGQPAYLTNALLDAGMAGLQGRCNAGSVPIGVLTSSQSASFTHVGGQEVSLASAVSCVLAVLDSWSASVTRFVMVLNVDNEHWLSASVSLSTGRVTLYDSLGGSSQAKTHILSRVHLFARLAERRWRAVHPDASVKAIEWQMEEVNTPRQKDHYNCGLFAFAFIWCFAHGLDMTSFPVVGDHLRLSLIYYVLMSGTAREETQRA